MQKHLFQKPKKQKHNHTLLIKSMFKAGKISLQDIRLNRIHITHENNCNFNKGGFCNCNPSIIIGDMFVGAPKHCGIELKKQSQTQPTKATVSETFHQKNCKTHQGSFCNCNPTILYYEA